MAAEQTGGRPLLAVRGLTKVFPGQVALDRVDLTLSAGRIRALVGQNGSGKSTLIKILAGYHRPTNCDQALLHTDAGEVPIELGDPRTPDVAGMRFVHQDLALVDTLSAVENIAIGSGFLTRGVRIDWRREEERARADVADLGFASFSVTTPVGRLAPSQRTIVALARAMRGWRDGASLLVLDEPTASLPHDDVEQLFQGIRRLRERGVAILYVSHHLDEVFEIADEVTVLRDGRVVATEPVDALTHERLIELMIGHKLETRCATAGNADTTPLLSAVGLAGGRVSSASVTVTAGEIVGIAGITGSGREHLIPLIVGQMPAARGAVSINGERVLTLSPRSVLAAGGAFVSADRNRLGSLRGMSVVANTTICDVKRNSLRHRLLHRKERREVDGWISRLGTKTTGGAAPMATLSGGNQQKVLFARVLRLAPKVILLDDPTSGIDVGAKHEIYSLIDQAATGGAAVLVASTDTDELVRISHRVLVMRRGRIAAVLEGADITSGNIERAQTASAGSSQTASAASSRSRES